MNNTAITLISITFMLLLGAGVSLVLSEQQMVAVLFYFLACLTLSLWQWFALPAQYKNRFHSTYLLLFLFQFAMPLFGSLGIFVFIYALHNPKKQQQEDLLTYPLPELPVEPTEISDNPEFSLGGLLAVLKHSPDIDKKLSAVMSAQNMPSNQAMPIFKLALKDLEDDVRLLAYSSLDKKESEINSNIHKLMSELNHPEKQTTRWRTQRRLAEQYWELSYLGLSEGVLRQYVLEKAASFAEQSLNSHPQVGTEAFLGRIYLALGEIDKARAVFELAADSGIPRRHVYPYLAEIAFIQKRYKDCEQIMSYLPSGQLGNALLQLKGFWNE